MEKEWSVRSEFLHSELDKVMNLLESLYDMKILPVQYRNAAAASYIYDYMSGSDAELESTLERERRENGIERIEEKLDAVILRLEDVVYENRCLRRGDNKDHTNSADNHRLILKNLIAEERDEKVRMQYEKIADIDEAVTEFFNNADYIEE